MKLTIVLNAKSCSNRWPQIRIYNNADLIDNCTLTAQLTLNYEIDPAPANTLTIEFYNKSFGDNDIWDVSDTEEMQLQISDILFDDVSVDHLLSHSAVETQWTANQLIYATEEFKNQYNKYHSNGIMTFNGRFRFEYRAPVYEFLINAKYKIPHKTDRAFYSNSTELFHYEQGFQNIEEIRTLLEQHEQTNTSIGHTQNRTT